MCSLNVCRLCCMLCSALLLKVFEKKGKREKLDIKISMFEEESRGQIGKKIEKGGNVVGHFMVATDVKKV